MIHICVPVPTQLVAEVLERAGRLDDALRWARAEIGFEWNQAAPSKARSGLVLGRVHAERGEHALSVAAFESATTISKVGRFLVSECLAVRGRVLAGNAAGGVGGHWSATEGRERMAEVLGRMQLLEEGREALAV